MKQKDKVGRPDIDSFEAVMVRENREKGYVVGFGFTVDAEREVRRFQQKQSREIVLLTVRQLLEIEQPSAATLPMKKPVASERSIRETSSKIAVR